MKSNTIENLQKVTLLLVAFGLIPIALSYGLFPEQSLGYLFGINVSEINSTHIFRAVMGLYLAMVVFWIWGALKREVRVSALYSMVVFMFGLAVGRILSLILDGIPNWLLLVYLGLEVSMGFIGIILISKSKGVK